MGDTNNGYLDAVKLILGIDNNDADTVLTLLTNDTISAVLSYCRIEVLPRQLEGLIPQLVAEQYKKGVSDGIKAITEGERRIEYSDADDNFLSSYHERLKPFISRRVYVPSERTDYSDEGI